MLSPQRLTHSHADSCMCWNEYGLTLSSWPSPTRRDPTQSSAHKEKQSRRLMEQRKPRFGVWTGDRGRRHRGYECAPTMRSGKQLTLLQTACPLHSNRPHYQITSPLPPHWRPKVMRSVVNVTQRHRLQTKRLWQSCTQTSTISKRRLRAKRDWKLGPAPFIPHHRPIKTMQV